MESSAWFWMFILIAVTAGWVIGLLTKEPLSKWVDGFLPPEL